MKKRSRIALAIALILSVMLAFPFGLAFAEDDVVAPMPSNSNNVNSYKDCISTDVDTLDFGELAEGGRSYTQSFLLKNSCTSDLTVVANVQTYDGEASINNNYKIADDWLTFVGGQTEYIVSPGQDTVVKLRVFLPNSVKGASYYTAVGLKLKDGTNTEDKGAVNVRMDVLGEGFSLSGTILSNYAQALAFGGSVKAGVKIKNTGTGGFLSKYTLKRGSVFGSDDFETIAEDTKEIPAGGDAEFYGGNYTSNQYGIYKIQQTVSYVNNEGKRMESTLVQTVINLPLVSIFIAGGVLVAIVSLLVIAKVMKHRRAEKEEDSKAKSDNEL